MERFSFLCWLPSWLTIVLCLLAKTKLFYFCFPFLVQASIFIINTISQHSFAVSPIQMFKTILMYDNILVAAVQSITLQFTNQRTLWLTYFFHLEPQVEQHFIADIFLAVFWHSFYEIISCLSIGLHQENQKLSHGHNFHLFDVLLRHGVILI